MQVAHKTSISVQDDLWKKLQGFSNRSAIINEALRVFFSREKFLEEATKEAEEEYWKLLSESLSLVQKEVGVNSPLSQEKLLLESIKKGIDQVEKGKVLSFDDSYKEELRSLV